MNPSKKSTIAILYHPLLYTGGVESHLLSIFRLADKERFRFIVIGPCAPPFSTALPPLGVSQVDWQLGNPLFDLGALRRLIGILKNEEVNLLNLHIPRVGVIGRLAARWVGIPIVATIHLSLADHHNRGPGFGGQLWRALAVHLNGFLTYYLTEKVIFVSQRVYQDSIEKHLVSQSRAVVIPNGVDLTRFASFDAKSGLRSRLEDPSAGIVFLFVGRLHYTKGVDTLLDAAAILQKETQPPWQIWLVGDGEERAALQAQAERLGLGERVRFLGFRQDIPDLLAAADVFVLPSRHEGMPVTVLEAMAAGLPLVVTPVGEIPTLVSEGQNGLLVAVDDAPALAAALQCLLSDADLRRKMGSEALRCSSAFDERDMVKQIEQVFAQVLTPG